MDLVDEESLSHFDPSRYYPARIGDSIGSSCIIRSKLGYGRSSTTWLCQDLNKHFKVLKILTADATSHEAQALKHIEQCSSSQEHPGKYCVRRSNQIFSITSNGRVHQCFLFEPLGASLLEFTKAIPRNSFGSHNVRWITTYLLHAMDFLHSNGVVHTDIKLDNIQMTLPNDEEEFLNSFIAAETHHTSYVKQINSDLPIYRSRQMVQDELGYPILCDLGSAVLGTSYHKGLAQALPYRAPEVIFGADWNSKIDVWNLGVLIWELLFGERIFGQTDELSSVSLMVQYLGLPPKSFLGRCAASQAFFDEKGDWKHGDISAIHIEDRVEAEATMPLLFDFMRCMWRWDPDDRISASELLKHPWLHTG
ncbi:kinase-like protein [Pseudovirgaria hyperparasitica]|uniref:Kinase-like protein n=1 Tax=Pseudovirgaria hyperparasitica TaxID=470096 RepID=A0A6A6W188_9PEZI|nr:kinase-like protein [Pseudovirgaria hyperparasitica]KAF2756313.1 kinase-like protein [Pseudovirgaria hyperparasitica]